MAYNPFDWIDTASDNPYKVSSIPSVPVDKAAPTGFMAKMPWLQVGGAILGGGLNSINQSQSRMQQRNAISGAVDAEQKYRKGLIQERRGSVSDDQGNLNILLSSMKLNGAPQAIIAAQQTYNQLSQSGANRRNQLDTSVLESHRMEQQLEASKPKKYGAWDAVSDFIGGALGGGQAANSMQTAYDSNTRANEMRQRENEAFEQSRSMNSLMYDILMNQYKAYQGGN